ncbi:precorrin-8X methylmutase [Deltaproteobacteria bacterium TL4]
MYLKDPVQIETRSMEIIEAEMDPHQWNAEELAVVKRTIHTTGDLEYQHLVDIKADAIASGMKAIESGCRIVTDTQMAFSGINKRILEQFNCRIDNFMTHDEVFRIAKEQGITRAMAAMEFASQEGVDIFVIGNAPTALYKIGELIEQQKVTPKLVIGTPVGFVGATESKDYIRQFKIPSITTIGRKGGSAVSAAIMNAILLLTRDRNQ